MVFVVFVCIKLNVIINFFLLFLINLKYKVGFVMFLVCLNIELLCELMK